MKTLRMPNKIDMIGRKCGRLAVVGQVISRGAELVWFCICECGNSGEFRGNSLRNGDTKSCGCLQKERASKTNSKHGMAKSPEMKCYQHMKGRCYNPKNKAYKYYGSRGIRICNRWLKSFLNFYLDMGPRPSSKHSIDRIKVNKHYSPSNCRWATSVEQSRNMRSNRWVKFRGFKALLSDWADYLGVSSPNLGNYLNRGNSMEQLYRFYLNRNKKLPSKKTKYNKHILIRPTSHDFKEMIKPTKWRRRFLTKDIYPPSNPLTPKDEKVYGYFLKHPGEYLTPNKISRALDNPDRKHSAWAYPALKKLLSEGKITVQKRGQYKVIEPNN